MLCSNGEPSKHEESGFCEQYDAPDEKSLEPMYWSKKKKIIVGIIAAVLVVFVTAAMLVPFILNGGSPTTNLVGYWETEPLSSIRPQSIYFGTNGNCIILFFGGEPRITEAKFNYTTIGNKITLSNASGDYTGTYSIEDGKLCKLYLDGFDFINYRYFNYMGINYNEPFPPPVPLSLQLNITEFKLDKLPFYVTVPAGWRKFTDSYDTVGITDDTFFVSLYYYPSDYDLAGDIAKLSDSYPDPEEIIFETIGGYDAAYFTYLSTNEYKSKAGIECLIVDSLGNQIRIDAYVFNTEVTEDELNFLFSIIRSTKQYD